MSNTLGITVTGFDELKRKIELLANDKDKKTEMLLILRQIAKPTLNAARVLAPVEKNNKSHIARGKRIQPGNLKKSIGFITGKGFNPTIYVGPRVKGNFQGWYGHMVESGHDVYNNPNGKIKQGKNKGKGKSVLARKSRKNPGSISKNVAGKFFLKEAEESTKGVVTADAEKRMALFIQRRIDKLS